MDEAATAEAAGGVSPEHALDVLDVLWGDHYMFGFDPNKGFWAARHGKIGSLLTADDPEELGRELADDHGLAP